MKTLVLVRHGKSSWDYSVGDRDRPLQERGIRDALKVSSAFKPQAVKIDKVFSSPANRALHTCMIFMRQLGLPLAKVEITDELYDFSGESVFDFVEKLDDALDSVLVFGHNHAFTYVANSLGNTYIDNVSTSGLVHLDFNVDFWKSVQKGTTKQTIFPKDLR
ncbi:MULTISPECIES: SixA phosphatase family protein [Zobellia]|uniref:SixA phosphatase family protein n=1 Tax=Zobellia TaxID=112040 RepID=UPI000B52FD20|nr:MULTISPECIES: histidine phosphatase family protein [Zobellia]MBU3026990.1 histidine phosphatase family protein [Zobellia galactanivorans]OWW23840.1 histidine phosphatase family protein [Zobellia sp. OII3]